jgi:hypothetical protein
VVQVLRVVCPSDLFFWRLWTMTTPSEKPNWVHALEESLLLAIGLFTLITWIIMIGLFAHYRTRVTRADRR